MSSQFHLLGERRFRPFFLTQFLGAFNDNLFKNALVVLLTFQAASWTTIAPALLANLAAGIFILPFFLFSATAGQLADKYDKARLTRLVKGLEVTIMLIALAGFVGHSLAVLLGALFLLGCHSTLFGPVKYALLPQHLHEDELVGGNALVEAGTFVAILLGTLAGGLLAGAAHGELWIAGVGLVVLQRRVEQHQQAVLGVEQVRPGAVHRLAGALRVARARQHRPGLRDQVDAAFVVRRAAQRRAVVEEGAQVPAPVPGAALERLRPALQRLAPVRDARGVAAGLGPGLAVDGELQRIRGRVRDWNDLEPALIGRVEELIDFVTAPAE